ncbi:MAG: NAD(P)/FAD-dependent oxidoreductase [Cytophagales bacterium]|jgi:NADH dehydrogenase|nr:NAD(P)/FAD-dependent oxidoreductase [Cytophagales bacterium]MCA6389400.1 NAD(P)/FAD-dependent oxidoreductase [Cytophagales bacterium]MCA6393307.1 NAD(P)/FAD-dependent oxidoreductase [Cytophagales bacterium]MCA6396217.1 NAD(P)/FAD-dependent oxidoreductase [Cytophagales bacterium]MCA6397292.1 NAD(P)/FAD-dependent oxidoreductase [Cytophagales bacterium]
MPKLITTRTRIEDLGKPRVIVIGGGFGGLEVIKKLRGAKLQTVLFDKNNHHTFQPLLYQVATSGLETNSIVAPFRKLFGNYRDFYFRLAEVKNIKPEENYIETSIGGVKYDYLVIASGAVTNFYGMEEVQKNAISMKNIVDATKLRNKIIRQMEYALLTEDREVMNSLMDFVVVGGGPTGVELCGALSELKKNVFPKDYKELDMREMDVHLVEASPRLLNGMSEQAGAKALDFLTEMGVKVHLGAAVKSYDGVEVVLNTGEKLISRSLIWAAGVKGNPIGGLNGELITRGNRLLVDEFNRVKGYDNIFAIGDVALMESDKYFPKGHPQMAPPAQQQGRLVAKNIKSLLKNKPLKPFHYFDKGSMATVGRHKAVVDMKGIRFQGIFAWYVWMFVHLMSIVGWKNRVFTFFSWMWNYFSFDRSNRLIIGRGEEKFNSEEAKAA